MNDHGKSATPAGDDRARLLAMINANWMTQAIAAAVEFRLPDLLADGPQDLGALAVATDCHAASLQRLLRALVTLDICVDVGAQRFGAGPLASLLRTETSESLRSYALFRSAQWEAWGQLSTTVRSGIGFRKRMLGRDDFGHLDADPAAAQLFHCAMIQMTRRTAREVLVAFDFSSFRSIVDVGGGYGELLATILEAHPKLRGTVYDVRHARGGALEQLARAGLAQRASFREGSFFDAVPGDGDLYLLKSVLHDWDDARATSILQNCAKAMQADARLLVIERMMNAHPTSSARDQEAAASDLNMLVALSGRERTEPEFRALLDAAGLVIERIVTTSGAFAAIVAMHRT
jgi:hypothetical protein